MPFFTIDQIFFEIHGYAVSYVECIGTLFGLISVFYASRANILTWPSGIINEIFLFILFFQVQLYADMFLQVYFFIVTLYGWYNWKKKSPENRISGTSSGSIALLTGGLLVGSCITGYFFSKVHLYFPSIFKIPASFPYIDSFVMVASIMASFLLARKRIESWYLWITIDAVCVVLYAKKGVYFLALEYFIFLMLATYGLLNWKKQLNNG